MVEQQRLAYGRARTRRAAPRPRRPSSACRPPPHPRPPRAPCPWPTCGRRCAVAALLGLRRAHLVELDGRGGGGAPDAAAQLGGSSQTSSSTWLSQLALDHVRLVRASAKGVALRLEHRGGRPSGAPSMPFLGKGQRGAGSAPRGEPARQWSPSRSGPAAQRLQSRARRAHEQRIVQPLFVRVRVRVGLGVGARVVLAGGVGVGVRVRVGLGLGLVRVVQLAAQHRAVRGPAAGAAPASASAASSPPSSGGEPRPPPSPATCGGRAARWARRRRTDAVLVAQPVAYDLELQQRLAVQHRAARRHAALAATATRRDAQVVDRGGGRSSARAAARSRPAAARPNAASASLRRAACRPARAPPCSAPPPPAAAPRRRPAAARRRPCPARRGVAPRGPQQQRRVGGAVLERERARGAAAQHARLSSAASGGASWPRPQRPPRAAGCPQQHRRAPRSRHPRPRRPCERRRHLGRSASSPKSVSERARAALGRLRARR